MIKSVLQYHHIPPSAIRFIIEFYSDFRIHVATDKFIINSVPVESGVSQGGSLSPLLFNLCMNTLIDAVKDQQAKCIGYVYDTLLSPHHWFQFADDTVISTSSVEENRLLLNVFSKWCNWADFIIRVD